MNFSDFIRSPWKTLPPDRLPENYLENPVYLWNKKVESYLHVIDHLPSLVVRYEDLLKNPEGELQILCDKFNLRRKTLHYVNWYGSTKNDAGKNFDYYREYYLQELWRSRLSSADIEYINRHLDNSLLDKYNYLPLS